MITRIAVDFREKDSESRILERKIRDMGLRAMITVSRIYTIDYEFTDDQLKKIAGALHNENSQTARINKPLQKKFDWALELGFLPGVTDNVANTATEIINDAFGIDIGPGKIFSSKILFIDGDIGKEDVEKIAKNLVNTLIERFHVKSFEQYSTDGGMDPFVPVVRLKQDIYVDTVDLNVGDEELRDLGKKGIEDRNGNRRGPLALDLDYLYAIRKYFKKLGRPPTDIELEAIAQTWSEHCKHTYFSAQIDEIKDGLFREYIKKATEDIGKDFCVSVFKDNSGGIIFDDDFVITDKVETHNTPSALDPFGGAITGIVGVNRDTIGFGLGAKPIANRYGFCLGRPEDTRTIYRTKNKTVLPPKRIFEGVVSGVNVGGNCSGIPTPQGFIYFDDSYRGKPLVFAGTVGLIPRKINGGHSHEKQAQHNDNIVVIGGRVGKDGIHGATFSSEALDEGSPVSAVQIGDPITQKKLSDAIINEARPGSLYNSITDNGAGGLSCSVAEMARESRGFAVDLEKVPLKYSGMQPWEIWVSESQERMTLSIPDEKLVEFKQLMHNRGIECSVIGRFNDSGKAIVRYNGKEIMNIDMDFLHDGLPRKTIRTVPYRYNTKEPSIAVNDHAAFLERMIGAHNICSFEFISTQYDHEVQNSSVVKPLQGKGRVNGTASVLRPVLHSKKGVVLSQSLYPRLSEINAYDMAACAIDTSIRNCIAAGGDINHLALLDNFCWCSSDEPERISQLKDAARGCYDYAVAFGTPFISGKDSMFNDFRGLDESGNRIKVSVLPTLLVSSVGVVENIEHTCTMDFKFSGDLIYVIGKTKDECGGSEFYNAFGELGTKSPKVDARNNRALYEKIHQLHKMDLLSACASVGPGGLLVTLAKMSIAGRLGALVDIRKAGDLSMDKLMYSETQGRFVVTIDPNNRKIFEKEMEDFFVAPMGVVSGNFSVRGTNIDMPVERLEELYKKRFAEW